MPDQPTVERLLKELRTAHSAYHRLVLLVGPAGAGKEAVLRQAAEECGGRLVNVNLELSRRLLDLTSSQRALRVAGVLDEILGADQAPAFLHRIEIIFDPEFRQDPLRLLRQLSRTRTVAAAWSGAVGRGFLTYAEPGHPEYRQYGTKGLSLVEMPAEDSWRPTLHEPAAR